MINIFNLFKEKNKLPINNNSNNFYLNNSISISEHDKKFVSLHITGINNTIVIKNLSKSMSGHIEIWLRGNNNSILIDEGLHVNSKLVITMGRIHKNFGPITNSKLTIGKNNGIGSSTIITYNSNTSINIGNNCMFAFDTIIFNTDAHPIIDYETKKIINKVKEIKIGNHVWIGAKATILKNTIIPDDSIIGYCSIVSGNYIDKMNKFPIKPGGIIIAGNPGKIVRGGVSWKSDGSDGYIQNQLEDING